MTLRREVTLMYITLKTGKNKCELRLISKRGKSRGKREEREGKEKKEKIRTSSNTGEIGGGITSDSELDFPFQP